MGDDLGDDWGVGPLSEDGEEEDSVVATPHGAPNEVKKKKKKNGQEEDDDDDVNEARRRRKRRHDQDTQDTAGEASMGGTKRGKPRLSVEGFEEGSSDGGSDSPGEVGGGVDERSTLKEEMEEEARKRRIEKKKEKFKALKAKVKENKQRRIEAESKGGIPGEHGEGAGERGKGARVVSPAPCGAAELWAAFCNVRADLVTPLEKDRPWISDENIARVEGFGSHTPSKLVGFIKASLPDWKKKIQNRNIKAPRRSPSVVIVCSGARRCVQVMKHLTAFRCQVVKLFAKHLKLEEQKVMLKKGCFPLAVGTPGRVRALAASGSLRLDECALLILDAEKNVKGRNVLDMNGVAADTMALLADHVRPCLASSSRSGVSKGGGGGGEKGTGSSLRIAVY